MGRRLKNRLNLYQSLTGDRVWDTTLINKSWTLDFVPCSSYNVVTVVNFDTMNSTCIMKLKRIKQCHCLLTKNTAGGREKMVIWFFTIYYLRLVEVNSGFITNSLLSCTTYSYIVEFIISLGLLTLFGQSGPIRFTFSLLSTVLQADYSHKTHSVRESSTGNKQVWERKHVCG